MEPTTPTPTPPLTRWRVLAPSSPSPDIPLNDLADSGDRRSSSLFLTAEQISVLKETYQSFVVDSRTTGFKEISQEARSHLATQADSTGPIVRNWWRRRVRKDNRLQAKTGKHVDVAPLPLPSNSAAKEPRRVPYRPPPRLPPEFQYPHPVTPAIPSAPHPNRPPTGPSYLLPSPPPSPYSLSELYYAQKKQLAQQTNLAQRPPSGRLSPYPPLSTTGPRPPARVLPPSDERFSSHASRLSLPHSSLVPKVPPSAILHPPHPSTVDGSFRARLLAERHADAGIARDVVVRHVERPPHPSVVRDREGYQEHHLGCSGWGAFYPGEEVPRHGGWEGDQVVSLLAKRKEGRARRRDRSAAKGGTRRSGS